MKSQIEALKENNLKLKQENEDLREKVLLNKSNNVQQQELESKMKIEIQNYETKIEGLNDLLEKFKDQQQQQLTTKHIEHSESIEQINYDH